jgi:hypothetical protein
MASDGKCKYDWALAPLVQWAKRPKGLVFGAFPITRLRKLLRLNVSVQKQSTGLGPPKKLPLFTFLFLPLRLHSGQYS